MLLYLLINFWVINIVILIIYLSLFSLGSLSHTLVLHIFHDWWAIGLIFRHRLVHWDLLGWGSSTRYVISKLELSPPIIIIDAARKWPWILRWFTFWHVLQTTIWGWGSTHLLLQLLLFLSYWSQFLNLFHHLLKTLRYLVLNSLCNDLGNIWGYIFSWRELLLLL